MNGKYVGFCRICGKKEVAKTLCYRHYTSARKYGSPTYVDDPEHRAAVTAANTARLPRIGFWKGKRRGATPPEVKAKMSAAHLAKNYSGRGHHRFGKAPAHLKRIEYNGTIFRSNYEVRFAKMLDSMGVKWEYEKRRFDLIESTYLPDFYLPEYKSYFEVKGWLDARAERKLDLFRVLYPSVPLILVPKPFFKHLVT